MPAAPLAPLRLVVFATAVLLSTLATHAQEAALTRVHVADDRYEWGYAYDVSDAGELVGYYSLGSGRSIGYRWTSVGGFVELPPIEAPYVSEVYAISDDGLTAVGSSRVVPVRWLGSSHPTQIGGPVGRATGVSDDGKVVVGKTSDGDVERAFRWTAKGGLQFLDPIDGFFAPSEAWDVSGDGAYVVGRAIASDGYYHAFRWSAAKGTEDLGGLGVGDHVAFGVSDDGKTVVGDGHATRFGTYASYPFTWTEDGGVQELPNTGLISPAKSITDDGRTIVGGDAIWVDREGFHVETLLRNFNVDLADWSKLHYLEGISSDGTYVVGHGWHQGDHYAVLIRLPPLPTLTSNAAEGSLQRVAIGDTFQLAFEGAGPNDDPLRFFAAGLPAGASTAPANGNNTAASFQGTLTWTPTAEQIGTTHDVHLYVRDRGGRRQSLRFRLRAVDNGPPTIEAPLPVVAECEGDGARVELQTVVEDPNGDDLTVRWSVNGRLEKTQSLAAGSLASFDFGYVHGESVVRVEAIDDDEASAWAETTVTVQDTTAPIVIVAPDVRIPVERGELFALASRIVAPVVEDACDEEPSLTNDAPAKLPLGKTTVTWTVADADGNIAKARQRIAVVNEAPVAHAGADAFVLAQAARTRVRLDGRRSDDADGHALTYRWTAPGVVFVDPSSSRPVGRFPVGPTHVTLTVTDEAGFRSKDKVRVVVKEQRREAPAAAPARVASATAYDRARRLQETSHDVVECAEGARAAEAAFFLGRLADAERQALDGATGKSHELALYQELRAGQIRLSIAASEKLYRAYLAGADESALSAGAESYGAALYSRMTLVD